MKALFVSSIICLILMIGCTSNKNTGGINSNQFKECVIQEGSDKVSFPKLCNSSEQCVQMYNQFFGYVAKVDCLPTTFLPTIFHCYSNEDCLPDTSSWSRLSVDTLQCLDNICYATNETFNSIMNSKVYPATCYISGNLKCFDHGIIKGGINSSIRIGILTTSKQLTLKDIHTNKCGNNWKYCFRNSKTTECKEEQGEVVLNPSQIVEIRIKCNNTLSDISFTDEGKVFYKTSDSNAENTANFSISGRITK